MDTYSANEPLDSFQDGLVGASLFRAIGLYPSELTLPENLSKIRDIAGYLNNHPDPLFVISTLSRHSTKEKPLEHFFGFVKLHQQRSEIKSKLDQLDKELGFYE